MHEYELAPVENVRNDSFSFYKLIIDGRCPYDEFCDEMWNGPNKGVMAGLISQMDNFGHTLLPKTKFRKIEDAGDDIFEFKRHTLRIYVRKKEPNIYIILGGVKTNQKKDIARIRRIVKDYEKSTEQ